MRALADTLLFFVALPIFLVLLLALGGLFVGAAIVGGLTMTAREACSRPYWICSWCGHAFTKRGRNDHKPRLWRPVGKMQGHGMCRECEKVFIKEIGRA